MQNGTERTPLLIRTEGLSVLFAIICVIDVFGVYPVVTLPKPIIDCGYYGILLIFIICSVQIYTAILLGKCWNLAEEINPGITRKNRYPYSALAELTFGKYLSNFVTFLVDITVFSGGIPNLIVAAHNLQMLGLRISDNHFDLSFCYWIIILGSLLCPVLWIGSPKDMKVLCTISVTVVSSVYILTCYSIIFTKPSEIPPQEININMNDELWKILISAYGIVTFQFDIHPTILTIQMDMIKRNKLPSVIIRGFLVSLFMFGTTTVLVFLKYGSEIKPSLLETLPTSISLHIAAVLVALQLCLTSALTNSALYQQMENCLNISREFNSKRCILRTILTILAIIIAESVPRFDLVMSLIGGTLIGPLVFILPPLFYIKMIRLHKEYLIRLEKESFTNIILKGSDDLNEDFSRDLSNYYEQKFKEELQSKSWVLLIIFNQKVEIFLCFLIIFSSSIATGFTIFLNFNNAALSYANLPKPCIYNISRTLLYL